MTFQELQALYNKRAKLIADARAVLDLPTTEKRAINSDEQTKYDAIDKDIDTLAGEIKREEKLREQERSIKEMIAKDPATSGGLKTDDEERVLVLQDAARSWLKSGKVETKHYEEWRALQVGSDTEGGYLVMPEQFVNMLIKFVDDLVVIRGLSTVLKVEKAVSLGAPSLDVDISDSDWTTELQTGSEDDDMAFGKRVLHPHPFAKRIKISKDLMRQSVMPIEQLVLSRMGHKFGITEEKAFMTGDGQGKPLGLFVANSQGITTARDISEDNTTTSITFDGLKNAKGNLKSSYKSSPTTTWIFHRDATKQIGKLKDGEGRYIWEDSVKVGEPDILLGVRVTESENAPNTFTSGNYVGLIGDMKHYWIADAMDLQIQRLDELYAETNQVGFIGRQSTDAMPVLEEAFTRVKLA